MLFPDAGRPPSGAPAVASARGTINQENNRSPFPGRLQDRKSTRLNSSHGYISYAVFCLKKKKTQSSLPCIHIITHVSQRLRRRKPSDPNQRRIVTECVPAVYAVRAVVSRHSILLTAAHT